MHVNDILAIITIMFWALVPLFWIPVHGFSALFKKLGIFTYITPVITWVPIAWLIYANRELLLGHTVDLPQTVRVTGWMICILGMMLQIWTLRLLGGWGIMGIPEVTQIVESRIVTSGPFSIIRHPTYLSHTIMFAGVFLITGVIATGIITLLDIIIINTVVIPLEDRELVERFGEEYRRYQERVPAFFPGRAKK
jgi:protein-S-isoprenylcysteine O-methyltransferase Ste14